MTESLRNSTAAKAKATAGLVPPLKTTHTHLCARTLTPLLKITHAHTHTHVHTHVHAHTTNRHPYPPFIQSEIIFLASSGLAASSL